MAQCATKNTTQPCGVFNLVRETGLEPVRHKHTPLKRACLPIPALPHLLFFSLNSFVLFVFRVIQLNYYSIYFFYCQGFFSKKFDYL